MIADIFDAVVLTRVTYVRTVPHGQDDLELALNCGGGALWGTGCR